MKKTKPKPSKRVPKAREQEEQRGPRAKVDYWEEKWKSLRASVRVWQSVERIWSGLLTKEQRDFIEKEDSIGPDIVDIWAKLHGISTNQATVELGVQLNLISDPDRQQLLQKLGEKAKPVGTLLPTWNRSLGELCLGDTVIKRVHRLKVATNAILILDAFQETGWPSHLDDPLSPRAGLRQSPANRLQDVVKSLNENLKLIRFRGDGTGKGIVWKRV